ncbi:MAG: hypothetical protein WBS19_00445 [Candidatus Korobacteraceae bacterium]
MPRKSIAVVAAMRRELAPLLRGKQAMRVDGLDFFEFNRGVVAVGGIGRKAARRAVEAVIARYEPEVIISAGIAGALRPRLKVGDVIRSRGVIDADSGRTFAAGGDPRVVTVSSVNGSAQKKTIAQRWNFAEAVDMEASAVAEASQSRGIWFAAIKAISDELDFAMPPVDQFVDSAGKFETARFAVYIAMRPKWWSAVGQLNANSRLAAMNLSDAVRHLIDQRSIAALEEKISGT